MLQKFHFARLPRPVLIIAAIIYAAAAILYSTLWMLDARVKPDVPIVELGFAEDFVPSEHVILVKNVYLGSPAEKAGMQNGDKVVAINGNKIEDEKYFTRIWKRYQPGDSIHLSIIRPGIKNVLQITGIFRYRQSLMSEGNLESLANEVRNSYPVPFIVVGLIVLFLHLEDPFVWLLALLFGSLAATPGLSNNLSIAPSFLPFATGYQVILVSLLGPLFYTFFSYFPVRSSIDIKAPWLKYIIIFGGISFSISGFKTGRTYLPPPFHDWAGQVLSAKIAFFCMLIFIVIGLVSLGLNYIYAQNEEVKRKIRIIFWGAGDRGYPKSYKCGSSKFFKFLHSFMVNNFTCYFTFSLFQFQ